MDISIIVPLFNEAESLSELKAWIDRVMKANNYTYEILFINDGSTDNSWQIIEGLHTQDPNHVKGIKFRRNYGKSPALFCGFERAQGDIVVTMDADLQDSPEEIPGMVDMIKSQNLDLVSGWKKKRYDSKLGKNIPSKLFNHTARRVTGIYLHDMNCGLKAYRNEVVKNIEVYSEMHRYIPYLAKNAGFGRIGEKVVQHQARKYGKSKFGLNRFVNGYLDLMSLWFINKFGGKPMHFFGFWGSVMFLLSVAAVIVIGGTKLYALHNNTPARLITDNPWFYIALTGIILGTLLFLSGFIAELISRSNTDRNHYNIEKEFK